MSPVSGDTPGGTAYLALRREALARQRPTEELLQWYVLEGFLSRLTTSTFRDAFVLKGGVLLAAMDSRRPTRDIDLAARELSDDAESVLEAIRAILEESTQSVDGIDFDTDSLTAHTIRDEDKYSGVRVKATAKLATARLTFHVDVNVGDAIWPEPGIVRVPRLLGGGPIEFIGYPLAMVYAEKVVTAIQRGTTNTRWRDFADIWMLSRRYSITGLELCGAVETVARHRRAALNALSGVLAGYSALAQPKWEAWRQRLSLVELPEEFESVLATVIAFIDPILEATAAEHRWDPGAQEWEPV
ncbi:MAG: nucleotidyl transferase AbiEii/AbiGii toxin family protein [Actinomycetales bacterium]